MSGNGNGAIALPHQPQRIGQATAIEQSRAAAEVHAAILVAQQCPRNEQAALGSMGDACKMKALAERAFFRFSRGGSPVSGPSVHLARELARCWGNIQYGVAELSRDDEHGQSEMQAYAWDVQTNTRSVHVFIVPHKRDKRGGPESLTDMRDIYENNANNGARRVREAIFAVLPVWFVEQAKSSCQDTLKREDDGKSIHQRIAEVIDWFGWLGVREEQIVAKLGRASNRWDHQDVANLGVIFRSIKAGEISKDDEFPAITVTAEQIQTASAQQPAPTQEADPAPEPAPVSEADQATDQAPPVKDRQGLMKELFALLRDGGIGSTPADRQKRLRVATRLLNKPKALTTFDTVTDEELGTLIEFMRRHKSSEDLTHTLGDLAAEPEKPAGGAR